MQLSTPKTQRQRHTRHCLDPAHIFYDHMSYSLTHHRSQTLSQPVPPASCCSVCDAVCMHAFAVGLLGLLGDAGALNWSWMVHCMRRVCGRHVVVNRHFGALGPSSHKFTHSLTHSLCAPSLTPAHLPTSYINCTSNVQTYLRR